MRLGVVSGFAICGSAGVFPFLIMRIVAGAYIAATIDSLIVLGAVGFLIFAWRTGRSKIAGCMMVAITTLSCIILAPIIGAPILAWAYTVEVAALLMAPPRFAVSTNVALIAALSLQDSLFESTLALGTFVATAILVNLYSFIFAMITAHQQRQLETQAAYDPLTGIANRRSMEADLAALQDGAGVTRMTSAVAVLDLDHFKAVNDQHGHDAGDSVLLELARLVAQYIRNGDRFYRFGGEEFVLLMPATDEQGMRTVVGRLHAYLAEHLRGPERPQTVSIGAAVRGDGEDTAVWLARADAALYQAKAAGRNCIVYAGETGGAAVEPASPSPGTGTEYLPAPPQFSTDPPVAAPRR